MSEYDGSERRGVPAQIGRLEAQVENLEADVTELRADVKKILSELAEAKGSWKTLLAVAGFSGAIGAIGAKLAGLFGRG